MTRVKICGIRDAYTALKSIEFGADYLGFNFSPESKRQISLSEFEKIQQEFKQQSTCKIVFLFFKNSQDQIEKILENTKPDYIQYVDRDISIDINFLQKFSIPLLKQIGVKSEILDSDLPDEICILDSFHTQAGGGTGKVFPWRFVQNIKKKYFLAGGLNSKNVSEAVGSLHPFGVDVASGVESSPGVKDIQLIQEFIQNAKRT